MYFPKKIVRTIKLLLLVSVMASCSAQPAYAAKKLVKFSCDGYEAVLQRTGNQPITASIIPEGGIWTEVPPNGKSDSIFLYNIVTSKLAVMGKNLDGTLFLQIYRDIDFYHAHQPQHSLRCRVG